MGALPLRIKSAEFCIGVWFIARKGRVETETGWLFPQPCLLRCKDCIPWPPLQLGVAMQPGSGQENTRGNGLGTLRVLTKDIPDTRWFISVFFLPELCRCDLADPGTHMLSIPGLYNKKITRLGVRFIGGCLEHSHLLIIRHPTGPKYLFLKFVMP